MNHIKPLYLVLATLLIGGLGFYSGVQFQLSKNSASGALGNQQTTGQRNFGQGWNASEARMNGQRNTGTPGAAGSGRPMMDGFRPIMGEVINMDSSSLTVKLNDGSSKIVILSDTTPVSKNTEAKISEVRTGDKVGVFGITNSDGSVTAQSIELNPRFGLIGQ